MLASRFVQARILGNQEQQDHRGQHQHDLCLRERDDAFALTQLMSTIRSVGREPPVACAFGPLCDCAEVSRERVEVVESRQRYGRAAN